MLTLYSPLLIITILIFIWILINVKDIVILCLFPLSSNASVCLDAIPSHIYFLSSGVEYCLETKYQSIYMYGAEDSLGVVKVLILIKQF